MTLEDGNGINRFVITIDGGVPINNFFYSSFKSRGQSAECTCASSVCVLKKGGMRVGFVAELVLSLTIVDIS